MQDTSLKSSLSRALDVDGDGKVDIHDFLALFTSRGKGEKEAPGLEIRVAEIWNRRGKDLERLSGSIQEKVNSNRSLTKKSNFSLADRRMAKILNRLEISFNDKSLEVLRANYLDCLAQISSTEETIADLVASSSMTSEDKRGKIESRLDQAKNSLNSLQQKRNQLLVDFVASFSIYNVKMSMDQAEVLLSRIDSGDITRMTSIFAIVSQLTIQFSDAKQASGESTTTAQKYYAMYIGLLELQVMIQTEYIDRMDSAYLPGVSEIKNTAEKLILETQVLMQSMPADHIKMYRHNLKSQEFTLEVATIYENALLKNRAHVTQAREIVINLFRLAENTLRTVKAASDLVSLMKDSQGLYDEVMHLQTPSLVPFENLELKREFQAVTEKLNMRI